MDRIKDPERNSAIIAAIRDWIAAGRKVDALPQSPKGDVITKVRLLSKNKPAVPVRGGSADRGEMVRVDVFSMPNKRGKEEWYLVPIYPHQVMDKKGWPQPPMRSVVAYKGESEWILIVDAHEFRFSLHPRSYVEVVKSNGQILSGYFQGLNRALGAITLSNHKDPRTSCDDLGNSMSNIGAKTLLTITKHNVDRFGNKSKVRKEVRTWHGVACTSPSPPG